MIEIRGPFCNVALEPARDPDSDAVCFTLLPSLDELLGVPGFGAADAICLPGTPRPFDGWTLFGPVRTRGFVLH